MANRSDRGRGQPAVTSRALSPQSRMGPRPRKPSGPAVHDRANRPDTRLHPTRTPNVTNPLQRGSHPHRTAPGLSSLAQDQFLGVLKAGSGSRPELCQPWASSIAETDATFTPVSRPASISPIGKGRRGARSAEGRLRWAEISLGILANPERVVPLWSTHSAQFGALDVCWSTRPEDMQAPGARFN